MFHLLFTRAPYDAHVHHHHGATLARELAAPLQKLRVRRVMEICTLAIDCGLEVSMNDLITCALLAEAHLNGV